MDSGEGLYKASSMAIGRSASSMWRQSGREAFSTSIRDEDDEEALKWAALEKLPTYQRVRAGIMAAGEDGLTRTEVDVTQLGPLEKKNLLERLVKTAEEDNEKFLLKLKQRIDRVGIDLPTIEVRFDHLTIDAEAFIGSRAMPTIFNFYWNFIEGFLNTLHILPNRKKPFTVLHDINGSIKPGRLTLLLGPPGSGKTTLLLALAGKLDPELKVTGKVTYNGHEMYEFIPQRSAAYISQHDLHIGEMTVRETLAFSARCQGVGPRYEMLMELARREKEAQIKPDPDLDVFMKSVALGGQETNVMTDYTLKILGLDVCADTMVGNDMVRGISGGQKKRVTTGEMMVGAAKALFMDEISTGLDSSTTFQIVNSLKQNTHILKGTTCVALLQPAPETYDLFDDIILLSDGQIVYQGPRENVIEFFEHMGFKCPDRKGVADFLQEVTSKKDQRQYWVRRNEPYRFVTVKEFSEAFQSFHVGRKISEDLSVPFDKTKNHPAALSTNRYGIGKMELLRTLISRELLLMKRNSFVYIFKFFQLSILAFMGATLFLRTNMDKDTESDGVLYMGALFFALTCLMFNGFSELAMTVMKLPVFYKQRDLLFFPAWTYTLPTWVIKIPASIIECAIWCCITYYSIGYDPNIGRFFKQYVILLCVNQMANSLFRLIASIGRTMTVGNTIASFILVTVLALGGFILKRNDIKSWWIWGYWCSPLMYAQNAISVNEFLGHSWDKPSNVSGNLGRDVLESRGVFAESKWVGIGIGALIGFIFLFNGLFTVAMMYLNPIDKAQASLTKEDLAEKKAALEGTSIELSSRGNTSTDAIDRVGSSTSASVGGANGRRGMVLPFEPLSITFDEVRYSVDMPSEMKAQGIPEDRLELLKGVSGAFRPGVLTALMGVSGAGKTTLMDVLAGRKTGGYIDGNITISGYPKRQETFARVSGYCEQTDIHSPCVTVLEALEYSAWLRLSPDIDANSRKAFVDQVLELVELESMQGALVGMPGVNGLSTEQRKRLTIAVELVANPSIIFMDEPTSGLDARAAAIVMRTVRNTVDTGRTVVCTIHQPSIDIFEAFDELFLMKRGGEEIYVGPLGRHSCDLIKYFESIEGVSKIKDGYNPATWMLEVSSLAQEANIGVDFADIYKNSELKKRNKDLIRELSVPAPGSRELHFPNQFAQSFYVQCIACLWKQRLSYWRNPPYTAVRFIFSTVIALLFGSMFWDLGQKRDSQQDIFNAMGSMYGAVLFLGVMNAQSVQPAVSIERTVFYRERAAGMYSALPYALAQVMIELPYVFVQALLYGVIVYSMIGFKWTAAKFIWYIFFMYCTLLYYTFYGMMAVAVTPNHNVASIVSAAFYGIWNLFSGFLIPKPSMPGWWKWYYYMCPVAWTLYGLVASQFGDVENKLSDTHQSVKDFVEGYFDFKHDFLPWVSVILVGYCVLFAFIFAFSIKFFNFQKR